MSLVTVPGFGVLLAPEVAEAAPPESDKGVISGTVKNSNTDQPIENAIVILQCTCLGGQQERMTNARGIYSFQDLPSGNYTIQVLAGKANVSKITQLPRGAKFRANFALNPEQDQVIELVVEAAPVASNAAASMTVGMEEAKQLPVGSNTSRDFTAVVDIAPTASRDAAGISLAGTTGAESKYTVEGADITNPAFGTVGATLIQEFVQEVEIKESGYEAEFGGASGGQVAARRVAGSNTLRGEAGVRFAPRLAAPRFISSTDEALRVTQVGDYNAQAYAIVSGPIKKDKVFFTIGVAPSGTQFSLTQSFYNRIDLDQSGGYEDCPYENGTNDCVAGGNYIASEKFAEQKFRTGAFNFGYIAGIDWAVTPRHKLGITAQGGPTFLRTTYRLPFSFDPNAFGTNPSADPLGGTSRIATGVVNDHFGTSLAHTTLVALNYEGR
ncbi:MAG TPA: carboxypeptidase regulatory-like domain-containing protein, partial [Enhygromyxa sp.]|nr:carboxypeptidase regulatory-like domain-containing protein [Enhygromyxa sp.]